MELTNLKKEKQWVNWNYSGDTKVPISPQNEKTGTNDKYANTWGTFEQAKNNTKANGIGLIFKNGICGIDIDKRDINDPIVQDIFNLMDTYTEYSPSGKGFHILFTVDMNKLPEDLQEMYYQKNPHNKIECYISGITNRYFTFTENAVIDKPINERTEQLLTFLEKYMKRQNTNTIQNEESDNLEEICKSIIDIILASKQMGKFSRLFYNGAIQDYNGDESSADMALCNILAFYCGEDFELIDKLFCESQLYRKKWDRIDYKYNTITKAISNCNGNFYKHGINIRLVNKLKRISPEKSYSLNDIGISELFSKTYQNQIVYNATARQWYFFNGKVWVEDIGTMITLQKMKEFSKALLTYAPLIEDDATRESFVKYINRLGNLKTRETIVKDSRDKMYVYQTDFDKDKNLFNCQNGTLNLATFEFLPHTPTNFLSKISNVVYEPQAQCPTFKKFMNEIMQDNTEKITYLQKALGYSLTCSTKEETCFILYGKTTRNGKGTLTDTISYMLGDYAMTAMPETLSLKKFKDSTRASGDIARLNGCRFLNISEPSQQMVIDSALLKTLLGRDKVTARHLQQREFEFYPIFKLFINCNYLPIIDDNTVFSSSRVNVITFDKHFSQNEQDKHLKDKLKNQNEISGIFNWCLEGLKKYIQEGLTPPTEIEQATYDYERSNDKFTLFFNKELVKSNKNNVTLSCVYDRYRNWCSQNKLLPLDKSKIKEKLKQKHILKEKGTVNGKTFSNVIIGYELKHN